MASTNSAMTSILEATQRLCLVFFFQAEDGIRDLTVTGVQTCALPIWTNLMDELKRLKRTLEKAHAGAPHEVLLVVDATTGQNAIQQARLFHEALGVRSEERRVGKEGRSRWSPDH